MIGSDENLVLIKQTSVSMKGKRGLIICLPSFWVEEFSLKPGDILITSLIANSNDIIVSPKESGQINDAVPVHRHRIHSRADKAVQITIVACARDRAGISRGDKVQILRAPDSPDLILRKKQTQQ